LPSSGSHSKTTICFRQCSLINSVFTKSRTYHWSKSSTLLVSKYYRKSDSKRNSF